MNIITWPFVLARDLLAFFGEIAAVFKDLSMGCLVWLPLWLMILPIRFVMAILGHSPGPDGFIQDVKENFGEWLKLVGNMLILFDWGE